LDERLLAPFLIEQECREYIYAAKHLPHWVYVPDAVISEYPVDGVDSSESDAN
jgi:maltokinase